MSQQSTIDSAKTKPGGAAWILNFCGGIWLGTAILTFLFVYSSIGSALVPVREWFEMTEFQWFHWWPFDLAVALMCANILLATIKRPLRLHAAGTWLTHLGILLLCLGSWVYFGLKVEGDTPVFRRRLTVEAPGLQPASMPALPGARLLLGEGENRFDLQIMETDADWTIPDGDKAGGKAFSAQVAISTPNERFARRVTDGVASAPDEAAPTLRLEYEPQEFFYLADSAAVYLRRAGQTEWTQRTIHGLPRYRDRVASREDVWLAPGDTLTPKALEIKAAPGTQGEPLADIECRVTGHLRYAVEQADYVAGGDRLNPVIAVRLEKGDQIDPESQLAAFDSSGNRGLEGQAVFHWASSQKDAERLLKIEPKRLRIAIAGTDIALDAPVDKTLHDDPDLPFTPVEGSDYSYRIQFFSDGLTISPGRVLSVAVVEVKTSDTSFVRWASDDPAANRDMSNDEGMGHGQSIAPDKGIEIEYSPGTLPSPVEIVGGLQEGELLVAVTDADGGQVRHTLRVGEAAPLLDDLVLRITRFMPNARREIRPALVPPAQRQSGMGKSYSMIKLEIPSGSGVESHWLPYHNYVFENGNYAYGGRFAFQPTRFQLEDGSEMEAVFSRERRKLPAEIALDDFHMTTHAGGYSGQTTSILNWTSSVRFKTPKGWSDTREISVNAPAESEGLWFFQSSWDKPIESHFQGAADSSGFNYTGLGVGNRRGVALQLAGCIIAVLGMMFAFYVKPIILRNRKRDTKEDPDETAGKSPVSKGRKTLALAIGALLFAALVGRGFYRPAPADASPPSEFAQQVDLTPLSSLAVYTEGRLKSFDSFAHSTMRYIAGSRKINGQSPPFTYLDLMLRESAYENADVIYVKNKNVRKEIAAAVAGYAKEERLKSFEKSGLISPALLNTPEARELFSRLGADLMRTAKAVNSIEYALSVKSPWHLLGQLRVIPPPEGGTEAAWIEIDALASAADDPHAMMGHSDPSGAKPLDQMPEELRERLAQQWTAFQTAWRAQDAKAASEALRALGDALPEVNPALYPERDRLAWESWYFNAHNMTWIWLVYMLSVIFLLMSVAYKWRGARIAGLGIFVIAFGLHSFAMGLRWHVSGRFPCANMFEAVISSAWLGACAALILEWLARKTLMRDLFALGAAASSMAALMAAHFMPLQLNPDIGNMMPVLHDIWLYIHVNVIILAYCLIGMASITGTLYLLWRLGGGDADHARFGGAGEIIRASGARKKVSAGQMFDGATMVLMELSFVLLWAGIVMGAIWADHSWGRPWGWDPKEVFALNTFIVFIILIHVRAKARDKGLWTAILAVGGCAVMLFNWIVINFVIAGLHSYA